MIVQRTVASILKPAFAKSMGASQQQQADTEAPGQQQTATQRAAVQQQVLQVRAWLWQSVQAFKKWCKCSCAAFFQLKHVTGTMLAIHVRLFLATLRRVLSKIFTQLQCISWPCHRVREQVSAADVVEVERGMRQVAELGLVQEVRCSLTWAAESRRRQHMATCMEASVEQASEALRMCLQVG